MTLLLSVHLECIKRVLLRFPTLDVGKLAGNKKERTIKKTFWGLEVCGVVSICWRLNSVR